MRFWQAILLAGIPSLLGTVGVVVQGRRNAKQLREATDREERRRRDDRDHELVLLDHEHSQSMESTRLMFLREQRVVSHANVLRVAREALESWGELVCAVDPESESVKAAKGALESWKIARSEAELFASAGVRDAMRDVELLIVKRRMDYSAKVVAKLSARHSAKPSEESLAAKVIGEIKALHERQRAVKAETEEVIETLLSSVRADLGSSSDR